MTRYSYMVRMMTVVCLMTTVHAFAQTASIDLDTMVVSEKDGMSLLPAGTSLDRTSHDENLLYVDLTLPATQVDFQVSFTQAEAISDQLARQLDPELEFGGLVVQLRIGTDGEYKLLDTFAPKFDQQVFEPADEQIVIHKKKSPGKSAFREQRSPAVGSQPQGALTGVTVFTSAGHGWTAGSSSWYLQRPLLLNMVEDYGNIDQLNYFVEYLYNAGATVVPFRPVGYQNIEITIDQDDPEVTFTAPWLTSTYSIHYENGRTNSGISYKYTTANTSSETSVARYTPNIPEAGFYPVYTWVTDSTNRTIQTYRINYDGGATEVRIDHRMVGKGWIWLGNFYFQAGTAGNVEISNYSPEAGNIIADGIRFGNGIGDVTGNLSYISGYPREEEAMRYWAESETYWNANGLSTSIFDCCSSDQNDNVGTGARWGAVMNSESYNNDRWRRVYYEFHTNASSGSARGAVALISTSNTTYQATYADIVGEEIEEDMQLLESQFEHDWAERRNTYTGTYGAISEYNNDNEFDATIIEVAFHDNATDVDLLLDPKVRDAVGRSSVHAIVKFLNQLPGSQIPRAFAPVAPEDLKISADGSGNVTLDWEPPISGEAYGDAATGYRIFRSLNGISFDGGLDVGNVTTRTLTDVPEDTTVYFRIAAYNTGGQSKPSDTLAVRWGGQEPRRILVINAFDRLDRHGNTTQYLSGLGTTHRQIAHLQNSFNYIRYYAPALVANGYDFDSCTSDFIESNTDALNGYDALIWMAGEDEYYAKAMTSTEISRVLNYLSQGGGFFITGSNVGYHLDLIGSHRQFYRGTMQSTCTAQDSNSTTAVAVAGNIFEGMSLIAFNGSTTRPYDCDQPDVINAINNGQLALQYTNGLGACVTQNAGHFRIVNMAFPFEVINSESVRNELLRRVLNFIAPMQFDSDGNGIIDLVDYVHFESCLAGPDVDYSSSNACQIHDADDDDDVDLADFGLFQQAFDL